jgi:hypothetical protein
MTAVTTVTTKGETSALCAGVGISRASFYRRHRVTQLQTACRDESKRISEKPEYKVLGFKLICDATELAASKDADPPGAQGELARAQRQRLHWEALGERLTQAGILTIVVGSLPVAWYFLLRRIRELSGVIAGR